MMKIAFDPDKDVLNQAKRGVSLALASELDWEARWSGSIIDSATTRCMIALAPKSQTLYYVAFVECGATHRIISLRRATRREALHYVENI